jgi:hypothetical protein
MDKNNAAGSGLMIGQFPNETRKEESMSHKLYYFPIRGSDEQVRLFLHALEIPFEDVLVKRDRTRLG